MDVPLRRTIRGCAWWPMVIASFGLVLLITRLAERRFVARMDDTGFVTRGGTSFTWAEVTAVRREQITLNGTLTNDMLRVTTPRGTAYVPLSRTDEPARVWEYALGHLPASVGAGISIGLGSAVAIALISIETWRWLQRPHDTAPDGAAAPA